MVLKLDRMAIEEAGPNPENLASAIVTQLGGWNKATPLTPVAMALDIEEIRYEALDSFEGALLTTAERGTGAIVVNKNSNPQRQRFTLAHELGHFLNPWHVPHHEAGFMCSKGEIRTGSLVIKPGLSRHEVQELEANRFAIELLAPRKLIERWSSDTPSLEEALDIATRLELSKSAGARRYVELHPARVAIAFTHNAHLEYLIRSRTCPVLALRKGDKLIRQHSLAQKKLATSEIDVEIHRGVSTPIDVTAYTETLFQQEGYAMTLLDFTPVGDGEDDED